MADVLNQEIFRLREENDKLNNSTSIKEYEKNLAYYAGKVKDLENRILKLTAENNRLTK